MKTSYIWGCSQLGGYLYVQNSRSDPQYHKNCMWRHTAVILAAGRWKQEDQRFKVTLNIPRIPKS